MSELQAVEPAHAEEARRKVRGARTVVVKVGSNVLVGNGSSVIDRPTFCGLVESLANVADAVGRQVVLVTSGAVAVGRRRVLGESLATSGTETLAHKQALAAIGQPALMHLYAEEFGFYGKNVCQILLTRADLADRERFLNARNTLRELARMTGVIPIVNENDTVAHDEIRFGDNDNLAALVTNVVGADVLIILSDVDAVYEADPTRNPDAERIAVAYGDDPVLAELAGPSADASHGRGGMTSKVRAARVACSLGVPTVIAAGRSAGIVGRVLAGESVGTLLVPRDQRLSARKAWIGFGTHPGGVVVVDGGAHRALQSGGKSLLPGGIVSVTGDFTEGAPVDVRTEDGETVARGLVAYSAVDLQRIAGRSSNEIEPELGFTNGDAAIHADDLVLVDD